MFIKNIFSGIGHWIVYCFMLLNSHWVHTYESSHHQALSQISKVDREGLECFLRMMLKHSEWGYVIYSDKPICIDSVPFKDADPIGGMGHHQSIWLSKGISIWEKTNLPKQSPKFIFHIYQPKEDKPCWQHFLLINRAAFYRAVNDNITLFKYVLGPECTPDALLQKLTDPSEDFYTILKNDKVLIGILLGFGVNNALYVNRIELIREKSTLTPSFGYASLEEELDDLDKQHHRSYRLNRYFPRLYFGHIPNDEKGLLNNAELLNNYEEAQKKIQQVLASEYFLENVLEKFYEPLD